MRAQIGSRRFAVFAMLLAGALAAAMPFHLYGDPPPWAPAHGWRKKHDPYYVGYTGKKWSRDYGIVEGRCNREAIGAVLGGAAGAAVGSQVGDAKGREVAILVGAVAGAVIGTHIGREMDQTDRACIGHALELAGDNKRVTWMSADKRTTYLLTPVKGFERNGVRCREFGLTTTSGGQHKNGTGKACHTAEGTWRVTG